MSTHVIVGLAETDVYIRLVKVEGSNHLDAEQSSDPQQERVRLTRVRLLEKLYSGQDLESVILVKPTIPWKALEFGEARILLLSGRRQYGDRRQVTFFELCGNPMTLDDVDAMRSKALVKEALGRNGVAIC